MITAHDLRQIAEDLDRVGGWSAAESMIRDAADELERLQIENARLNAENESLTSIIERMGQTEEKS